MAPLGLHRFLGYLPRTTQPRTSAAPANPPPLVTADLDPDLAARLFQSAVQAQSFAHAPYSRFPVGAALLGEHGQVFAGCNVENASFGLTICAERAALFAAVAQGVRRFRAVFIAAPTEGPVAPCGACRQVLAEFAPELVVYSRGRSGEVARWRLDELLPQAMGAADLQLGGETTAAGHES